MNVRHSSVLMQLAEGPDDIRSALEASLADSRFDGLRVMVAFLRKSGYGLLDSAVERFCHRGGSINIVAGLDFGLTEPAAVRNLLKMGRRWPGQVSVRLAQTKTARRSFHPKIYWLHGPRWHRVIIGSANFTAGGLANNFEAAIILEFQDPDSTSSILAPLLDSWVKLTESPDANGISLMEPTRAILKDLQQYRVDRDNRLKGLRKKPVATRRVSQPRPIRGGRELIMDLTLEQGRGRMSQVQPPLDVWTNFFTVRPSQLSSARFFSLVNERTGDRERRPVVAHDHTYTLEMAGARVPRPAILRMWKSGREFRYAVFQPKDSQYRHLDRILASAGSGRGRRRIVR